MPIPAPVSLVQVDDYAVRLKTLAVTYAPRLAAALLVLVVGWYVIGWISRLVGVAVGRLDVSLRSFLTSLFSILLKVLLLVSVAGMLGIETTSFVAILGAASLAVGLALQGTLANFAGGVLILLFKPFTVGDTITSQGNTGVVQAIQIFNTLLLTATGDTVILPNGATSNNVIVNKGNPTQALLEMPVRLPADTDLDALRQRILPELAQDEAVLPTPAPTAVVTVLAPRRITVAFRAYTKPGLTDATRNRLMNKLQELLRTPATPQSPA